MNYKINATCKHCNTKLPISINNTMFGKGISVRCNKCDDITRVKVPEKEVFKQQVHKKKPAETFIVKKEKENIVLKLEVRKGDFSDVQFFSIDKDVVVIGRKSNNSKANIKIKTTDMYISREHIIIKKKNNKAYVIIDNHSRNGTLLNNNKLNIEEEIYIEDGDIITIGKTEIEARLLQGNNQLYNLTTKLQ